MKCLDKDDRRALSLLSNNICHLELKDTPGIIEYVWRCYHVPYNRIIRPVDPWPSLTAAIAKGFNYRHRGLPSDNPFLATSFLPPFMIYEVRLPARADYDDPDSWTAIERKMTDIEFSEINEYATRNRGINKLGAISCTERVIVGYVRRYRGENRPARKNVGYNGQVYDVPEWQGYEWIATLNLDPADYGDEPAYLDRITDTSVQFQGKTIDI